MGAVYLAEDTNLADSLCAVKQMLDLGAEMDEYVKGRFLSEMQVLTRLRHPAIPNVRDFFQDEQGWFLVMDYIQGNTLEEELEAHRRAETTFPSQQAVADMVGVLDVLQYLHSQTPQVLHRDIKPANLIRDQSSGKLTVVDFGLARSRDEKHSALHTTVGTLGYSAQEQLMGKPEVRSDLYSVAVTLYEMVSGIRPTLAGVKPLTAKTMPQFDAGLSAILARAAHLDVKPRFASAEEFRQALESWQGGPTQPQAARSLPRKRSAGLVLGALLAAGLAWAFAFRGPKPTADPGLQGDLFSSRSSVVGLAEDVGLFWIEGGSPQQSAQRAKTVARRLNQLYHTQCPKCGRYLLEPEGIRVGRYQGADLVVFYGHMHGDEFVLGPELVVTVDPRLAKQLGVTPRFAAGYWRDLVRDVVALSRGESSQNSPLGPAFLGVVQRLRQPGSGPSLERLRAAVASLSSKQAKILQNAFRKVPDDFRFEADQFPEQNGFKPLTN